MAHGSLKEFDPAKESIEDFRERFDLYCLANNIRGENADAVHRKKAMFITLLGQATFAKLKVLASPTPVADLALDAIMEHLVAHYRPKTIEIAERFKFFKRSQKKGEAAVDFIADLRRLAKTCNFGNYLETAIRDQFVCGLRDSKCQKELLCREGLTADTALQSARAAEVVAQEAKAMQEPPSEPSSSEVNQVGSSDKFVCYRCGNRGHFASVCKYRNAKCHLCLKVGHLAKVCRNSHRRPTSTKKGGTKSSKSKSKHGDMNLVEADEAANSSDSGSSSDLHSIFQLGNELQEKFLITVNINGVPLEMEVDSGAERSTVPTSIFNEKLARVCQLTPSSVNLHQYDHSPLKVDGESCVIAELNSRKIEATLIVVDITGKLPLFGRDWMRKLGIDLTVLMPQLVNNSNSIHQSETNELLAEYSDVFSEELGLLRGFEATISVDESATPRFHKYRPVPFAIKGKVEETLRSQVAEGELVPVESSEWASPIVVVHKRDGGIRICGDFKVSINPVICQQVYPLPTPEEMFSMLANGESYTKLDLARAYKQMVVKKECQHLLTINTHLGLFQYTRLPFGISTAPSLWQKAMAQVLQGLPGVVCYIDDILVTGSTRAEHMENLRKVLDRLRHHGLHVKKAKCQFFQKQLEFLGHSISNSGIRPTEERIKSIQKAPSPVNKQELQSFLGMMTYNAKFLPSLSHVLHPLYLLLRKNSKWIWKSKQQKAFEAAKRLLCEQGTLAHYDVQKPIKLYCDASPKGLGACLVHVMQNGSEQPVAYASRSLQPAEQKYAQIEREALAIVFAVKRFHQYVYGRDFTLVTDHQPLCKILGPKEGVPPLAAARMQRWALLLSAYQYKIEFISGKSNTCADCMSRLPSFSRRDSAEKVHVIMAIDELPITAAQVAKETSRDKQLATVLTSVQHGRWPSKISDDLLTYYRKANELSVIDGCLMWGRRVIIPECLRKMLLAELHVNHIGMTRMKSLARSYIWWPRLDAQIEEMARVCDECALVADNPAKTSLHPWLVPKQPWERIHIDHASWGKHTLLVAIDTFSKWPEVHLVSSTSAQQTIDKLRIMFATHGLPITIVSDNGPPFMSAEFKQFMDANGVNHRRVPPYHPSSNGAAENLVKSVKRALQKSTSSESIGTKVSRFLASYRNTPHSITGRTPAEILLGRSPRTRLSLVHPCLSDRLNAKAEAQVGDKPPRSFSVDQEVSVRDLRPNSVNKWRKGKVTKRLGTLAYEVHVDGQTRKAHIDHMRPWLANTTAITVTDSHTSDQNDAASNVSKVRECRARTQAKRLIEEMD